MSHTRGLLCSLLTLLVVLSIVIDYGRAQYTNASYGPSLAGYSGTAASNPGFIVAKYGSGGYGPWSVALADVNGDGKVDVLVANSCVGLNNCTNGGNVGVLLGNGDGTFQTAVAYGSGGLQAFSVAVGDVNGDGRPDLLVSNQCASSNDCNGSVGVLLGNGDGTFRPVVVYSTGGFEARSLMVKDVNGDGKLDLLVANLLANSNDANGSIGVLLGNGDGTFQTAVAYGTGGLEANSVAVSDVNGDGKPDLLIANECASNGNCHGSVGVLLGNGDGSFHSAVVYPSGGLTATSVTTADVNADGKLDLLVANLCINANCNGGVAVLLGNGDGTFQSAIAYSSGQYKAFSIAVGDVNGDGRPDLLVTNVCASSKHCLDGSVGVLLGDGDGTFRAAVVHDSDGGSPYSVTIADLNKDGHPDFVVANWCNNPTDCTASNVAVFLALSPTTTKLTTSVNPSLMNQQVIFRAAIKSADGSIPDGETVTFRDGSAVIGTGTTANGVATFTTTSLAVGNHRIKASYPGDAKFNASSGVVKQVVNP